MKGVCDTPLHIFAQATNLHVLHRLINCNEWQSSHDFSQKTVGAYRIRPHVGEQAPQSKPSPHNFNRTTVGAYRIRPHMGEHAPQSKLPPHNFNRTSVGAYRIRPHMGEYAIETKPASSLQTYIIAHMEGVCDTPLHIFAQAMKLHVLHRLITYNEWQSS